MLRILRYVVLLAALVAYVMPFWGNFQGKFWPEFVRQYGGCATRAARGAIAYKSFGNHAFLCL
jgi:hypothetical protein